MVYASVHLPVPQRDVSRIYQTNLTVAALPNPGGHEEIDQTFVITQKSVPEVSSGNDDNISSGRSS